MVNRRQILSGVAGMTLASALPAWANDAHHPSVRLSGRAFGTSWSVIVPDATAPEALAQEIAAVLERIDRAMSPFRPDSEISAFNAGEAGWRPVGPDFSAVAAEALRIAALTGGAFDPSVGPLVGRYGFGPIRGERVGTYAGFACEPDALRKNEAGLSLDLCGIAKGYALDALAHHLRARGQNDYLIEIGGELLAAGHDPAGGLWHLGIADPLAGGVHTRLTATGLALATSGDAINVYEVGGRRYSHTIDPATAEPVVNDVASISVVHGSAMTADALATGLLVLGAEAGLALAERQALPVLYLLRDAQGGLIARTSRHFDDLAHG